MADMSRAFLQALYSIDDFRGEALLNRDEVNALGEELRISKPELLALIDELQRARLVSVSFVGLSLTPEGKALVTKLGGTETLRSTAPDV
ncbi:hypothetical protein F0U61_44315 [Archangium violaceum]|uniref:hypothetical protein n=1 Tax=Archangium violaceum TaxID=83451 RepID=UPI002B2C86E7|nr:hypothetical protein F0U61_44315 [Archangium violaceum]